MTQKMYDIPYLNVCIEFLNEEEARYYIWLLLLS
jgi:hypothetical protein